MNTENNKSKKAKEPVIKTQRLILRPLTVDDAPACFEWTSDPKVNKFMSYPVHQTLNETRQWLKSVEADDVTYNWGYVLKENNKLIGSGSISPVGQMDGYWLIGYNISYEHWNKGYTTEAARAMIDFCRNKLGVNKFYSDHAVDNPASGRVMEKCGLTFHHYGEYAKIDGSAVFKAKFYTLEFDT